MHKARHRSCGVPSVSGQTRQFVLWPFEAQSLCQRLSCRATKSSNDAAEPTVRLPKMTTAQLFLEWRISVSKVKLTASSSADKWFRTTQMSWWVSATGIGLNLVPLVLRDFQNVSCASGGGLCIRQSFLRTLAGRHPRWLPAL